jgi:hypothetical protein
MSMRSIAKELIESGDYELGIEFVSKYGDWTIANLLRTLNRSSFTESQLEKALQSIIDNSKEKDEPVDAMPEPVKIENDHDLIKHRNNLVRELDHYRGMLELIPTDEQRLTVALQILDLEDKLRQIWSDIEYFNENGHVREHVPEDEVQRVFFRATRYEDLFKIRNNYRTYVARAKGGKFTDKLPFYEAVLEEAERRLHA